MPTNINLVDMTALIEVGDLVLWNQTEPSVMGLVMEVFRIGFFGYPGIRVLWFGVEGGPHLSPCRMQDVIVLSPAKKVDFSLNKPSGSSV